MLTAKILPLPDLAQAVVGLKAEGKTVVHCHGVFDLLHIGHIRYFQQAREQGDVLVVTLTPDRFVDKGPHRPAFTQELRAEALASLGVVDYVAVNEWPTAEETLRLLKPQVYAKGAEFREVATDRTGKMASEVRVVEEIGAKMVFIEDIVFSSSNLINRYFSNHCKEVDAWLDILRQRYAVQDFQKLLDAMRGLKVLVVGDTIIDEYAYCSALGKSSKDPVLALRYQSQDVFAGGILAVANHVAGFAGQVTLATAIGGRDSREDFIRASLHPAVTPFFVRHKDAPTIVKRRYIDGYTLNKLLEIYVMDDDGLDPAAEAEFHDRVAELCASHDVVLVADYGHGAVSRQLARTMAGKAKFLAVNTQANAGNRGFHTIAKYPRADYVSLAHHEINLEFRSNNGELRPMMEEVAGRMGTSLFVVTTGRKGCSVLASGDGFVEVPTFTQKVVDRVGAGDAFLSVTALAARLGAEPDMLGFMGNVAGALAVEVVGNQKPIDRQGVEKFIVSLMK